MLNKLRFCAVVASVGCLGLSCGLSVQDHALGQIAVGAKVAGGRMVAQPEPFPGGGGGGGGSGTLSAQFSGIKLVENSELRQFITAARDCIKDKAWNDACTALQELLNKKEDSYVQIREKDASGKEILRWTSVKFTANNLIGSMADDGLDLYEQRFGATAGNKLAEAKRTGNRELLADVAQSYMHTRAGMEANDLLATYFLDRGQFFMAALRFEKLLAMSPERTKLSDMALFKAALSYRRAGDLKNYEAIWKKLEPRLRDTGGLKFGDNMVSLAKLEKFLDEIPRPEIANPYDWAYVRGTPAHTAQATGSPPLLDKPVFDRPTVLDKSDEGEIEDRGREAETRIKQAIAQISSFNNMPVLPGSFPIASNKTLVYRSYSDIRAVYLQDEKDSSGKVVAKAGSIAWKSTDFDGALANVLADNKMRNTLERWLNQFYNLPGFSALVYENSLVGTLSTDHRFVYAIDDLTVPCPVNEFQPWMWNQGNQVQAEVKPLVLQNTLYAYNLLNGRCEWRLGGGNSKEDAFADSHFLGVPVSVGGKLYVLNEKNAGPSGDSELRLVCIDPNKLSGPGRPTVIEPIQSLGMVLQQTRLTHDISRRVNAVHLGYAEGILVCPTNAGEVLGVDLMSRSLVWSYPYRDQAPPPLPFQPQFQPQPFPQPKGGQGTATLANWRAAPPALVDGKVVFTAPDANSIHCINLRDGTPVWKKRQSENDLFMAGVFGGKVVIVGKNAVRALNLEDGRQLWYLPTGDLPSGQGVASKNIYYLPLKKGEIVALDIDKGAVKAHNRAKNAGPSPGNLIFYEGTVVSQTPLQITGYPQLVARLEDATAAVKTDPSNPDKLLERGELLLADGQVQAAVNDLQKALDQKPGDATRDRARAKLYEALTDLLNIDFVHGSSKYLDVYRELCNVPGNDTEQQTRLAKYFRIVGQGREAQGRLVEAFQNYREFGALPIHGVQGGIASLDDPTHKIPTSVWLRGRVSAMIGKATPDQREPLEKKIAEEWKTVEAKKDIEAIRSFVGMFDVPFEVGREARLQLAENIMERNDKAAYLEAELSLQQLLGDLYRGDPKVGGKALAALAVLEEKKGSVESMKLAAAYYRALNKEFPQVAVRGNKTGSDLYNNLATDPRFRPYLEDGGTLWANARFKAHLVGAGGFSAGLQGFIFQPEGDLTPMMKHHRLVLDPSNANSPQVRLVDLNNNEVRWSQALGAVQANFQYFQYLYQQGQANTAYHPNAKFRYFQTKGHIAVFQVGTMVYCFDVDTKNVLWQQSMIDGNPGGNPQMMVQQVMPDQDGYLQLIVWNQMNGQRTMSPIGHVGSVQANYVALVSPKGLQVLDPLRGTLLWKKTDVSASTRAFGDDSFLFLVEQADGAAGSGRALRASDGMQLDVPDFGGVFQNRIRTVGKRILAAYPGRDNLVLKLYDIPSGKDVWTRAYDSKASVLHSEDPGITGVIDPAGKVIVLDAESGREIMNSTILKGRITKDDLTSLKEPLLLHDADHFYVALNRAIDSNKVAGGVLANNFSNGLRCGTVNGWFVALHRQPGQKTVGGKTIAWKAGDFAWHSYVPLNNQMVILEQFDQLPIILFSSRYNELINAGAGGNRWVSLTQSLDKKTGKVIWDPGPSSSNSAAQYFAFNLDLKGGAINMIGFSNTVQHYVDDGRKPADVPGGGGATPGNMPPGMGNGDPMFFPDGRVIRRPVRVPPAPPLPPVKD